MLWKERKKGRWAVGGGGHRTGSSGCILDAVVREGSIEVTPEQDVKVRVTM